MHEGELALGPPHLDLDDVVEERDEPLDAEQRVDEARRAQAAHLQQIPGGPREARPEVHAEPGIGRRVRRAIEERVEGRERQLDPRLRRGARRQLRRQARRVAAALGHVREHLADEVRAKAELLPCVAHACLAQGAILLNGCGEITSLGARRAERFSAHWTGDGSAGRTDAGSPRSGHAERSGSPLPWTPGAGSADWTGGPRSSAARAKARASQLRQRPCLVGVPSGAVPADGTPRMGIASGSVPLRPARSRSARTANTVARSPRSENAERSGPADRTPGMGSANRSGGPRSSARALAKRAHSQLSAPVPRSSARALAKRAPSNTVALARFCTSIPRQCLCRSTPPARS